MTKTKRKETQSEKERRLKGERKTKVVKRHIIVLGIQKGNKRDRLKGVAGDKENGELERVNFKFISRRVQKLSDRGNVITLADLCRNTVRH